MTVRNGLNPWNLCAAIMVATASLVAQAAEAPTPAPTAAAETKVVANRITQITQTLTDSADSIGKPPDASGSAEPASEDRPIERRGTSAFRQSSGQGSALARAGGGNGD